MVATKEEVYAQVKKVRVLSDEVDIRARIMVDAISDRMHLEEESGQIPSAYHLAQRSAAVDHLFYVELFKTEQAKLQLLVTDYVNNHFM